MNQLLLSFPSDPKGEAKGLSVLLEVANGCMKTNEPKLKPNHLCQITPSKKPP